MCIEMMFENEQKKWFLFGGNNPVYIEKPFQIHFHGWFGRKGLGVEWSLLTAKFQHECEWWVNFDEYTFGFLTPFGDYRIYLRIRRDTTKWQNTERNQ